MRAGTFLNVAGAHVVTAARAVSKIVVPAPTPSTHACVVLCPSPFLPLPSPVSRSKANSYARTLEQGIRQRDKAIAESYLKLEALKLEVDNMQRMLEDGAREAPYIVDRRGCTSSMKLVWASLLQLSLDLQPVMRGPRE